MNSRQKIKRILLNSKDFEDRFLLGLVCADPDYKLSLTINKKLHLQLKSEPPVQIKEINGPELIFTRFSDSSTGDDSSVHLFSNRSGAGFLIKKLKNIDYLFEIYDREKNFDPDRITLQLREIETVTAVFNIGLKNLKDKNLNYLLI